MPDDNPELEAELERLAEETGIDLSLSPDFDPEEIEVDVDEVEVFLDPGDGPAGTFQRSKIDGETQRHQKVHRPSDWSCSNCDYTPKYPVTVDEIDEAPEPKSSCGICETETCSVCWTVCDTCDTPLCSDHRDGFSNYGETLCPKHADEKREERTFEAKVEAWGQARQDAYFKLTAYIQQRKQRAAEQMQRHQEQLAKLDRLIDHVNLQNQLEMEKWQTQFEQEIARRKQILDEYETVTKLDIAREKQELEAEIECRKLDQERLKHDDKMELKQRQQAAKERIEQHKLEIEEERLRLQEAEQKMREKKLSAATAQLQHTDLP